MILHHETQPLLAEKIGRDALRLPEVVPLLDATLVVVGRERVGRVLGVPVELKLQARRVVFFVDVPHRNRETNRVKEAAVQFEEDAVLQPELSNVPDLFPVLQIGLVSDGGGLDLGRLGRGERLRSQVFAPAWILKEGETKLLTYYSILGGRRIVNRPE